MNKYVKTCGMSVLSHILTSYCCKGEMQAAIFTNYDNRSTQTENTLHYQTLTVLMFMGFCCCFFKSKSKSTWMYTKMMFEEEA